MLSLDSGIIQNLKISLCLNWLSIQHSFKKTSYFLFGNFDSNILFEKHELDPVDVVDNELIPNYFNVEVIFA